LQKRYNEDRPHESLGINHRRAVTPDRRGVSAARAGSGVRLRRLGAARHEERQLYWKGKEVFVSKIFRGNRLTQSLARPLLRNSLRASGDRMVRHVPLRDAKKAAQAAAGNIVSRSRGNDAGWKAWKSKGRISPLPPAWKSLRDSHIPTGTTMVYTRSAINYTH